MYTQCPYCDTLFRIGVAELKAGHGKVRCGACNVIFNALYNLNDEAPAIPTVVERITLTPAAVPASAAEKPPAVKPSLPTLHTGEPAPGFGAFTTQQPEQVTEEHLELAAEPQAVESTETPEEPYPLAQPPQDGWLATCAWSVAIVALITLLLAQYLYFARNELARHVELRPMLSALCAALNNVTPCDIPLRRDIQRIEVESRTVQPHPGAPNALLVQLTLVNKARFAQAYPALELIFTDLNETLVAKRRFQPVEYLEPGVVIKHGMQPDIPLQVTLELAAPDNGLNFELSSWNLVLY